MSSDFQTPMLQNILRGIVPVASVWGTDPTNLERCTDGDINTVTGTGSKVMGAAGNYGIIVFDLGSIKTVMIAGRLGIWSSAGAIGTYVLSSNDNVTWLGSRLSTCSVTSTEEIIQEAVPMCVSGRYIQIRFHVNGAATARAKIYEVMGWELTI